MPWTPIAVSAWRTSSSLKGLMMATTSFMREAFGSADFANGSQFDLRSRKSGIFPCKWHRKVAAGMGKRVGSRAIGGGIAVQPRIIGQNAHLWPAIGRAAPGGTNIMADRSWFFATDGQQHGPYSEDQFRDLIGRGRIRGD